ncbi:MAG: hypothetical protein AB2693_32580 [Candidatus Thiodiazotropha sp.]
MSLAFREGAIVALRGSKDDWQVIGKKHDGLVYKYVLPSRNTGEVKTAFEFEVFEKCTRTYFEMNQFLFENLFCEDRMFDEITIVPDTEDTDLASLLNTTDTMAVKPEPLSDEKPPAPIPADIKVPSTVNDPSSEPPKKRFKETTQETVEELLSHTTEVSTKRSTKWAIGTLKGMCNSFPVLFLFNI